MITGKFRHGKDDIPLFLGYVLAHGKIADLGLDVLDMMSSTNDVIPKIMLDDGVMLKVWYFYIQDAADAGVIEEQSFDEALAILDESSKGLEPFRKAFWELVVGFTPTGLQSHLRSMWKKAEKELKNVESETSTTSTSASQPSSE